MESTYGWRFAAIVAMVLGCVYVLLPTFLGVEDDDGVVGGARVEKVAKEGPLDVWFTVADGDPDSETLAAAEARLRASGARIERVGRVGDLVAVSVRPGQAKDAIEGLLTRAGATTVHPWSALADVDLAAILAAEQPALAMEQAVAGRPVAADAPVLAGAAVDGAASPLKVSLADAAAAWPVLVALDGVIVGVADAPEGAVTLLGNEGARAAAEARLRGAPLPEALARYVPPVVEQVAEAVEQDREQAWYEGLLPDTRINLGLDLQGGIDLTLQVDQEEAVLAQVLRDRDALRDQALRDNMTVDLRRERSRPAIRASFEGDFAKLKEYLTDNLRDYTYTESIEEDGKTWHVFLMNEVRVEQLMASAVEQVLETLRKRIDSTGVKEPAIVQMGGGRINIQLPGMDNPEQALDAIGTQAVLEFRLVDEDFSDLQLQNLRAEAERALPPEQYADDELVNAWLRDQGLIPSDRVMLFNYDELPDGTMARGAPLMLLDQVLLTGGDVNNATTMWDQNNEPKVGLGFKPSGAAIFCDVTTNHVKERFGIILDGQLRSAPQINEPICGGQASISMGQSADAKQEADNLALVLRTGSLTAPVDVGEVRHIGPSLGADAIRSGALGGVVGALLTFIVMAVWYRQAGLLSVATLAINVLMVMAFLALFGATLTLPGIAGLALTVGMAVDANIIVFERIREELALGVPVRKAVDTGFDKGLSAVIDGNLTTAIAGVVLYSYGTGPIRGFAVTLLIGIVTTIITGVFVSRTFLSMMTRNSNARLSI